MLIGKVAAMIITTGWIEAQRLPRYYICAIVGGYSWLDSFEKAHGSLHWRTDPR